MYQVVIKMDYQAEITYCFNSYKQALIFKDKIQEAYKENVSMSEIVPILNSEVKGVSQRCA